MYMETAEKPQSKGVNETPSTGRGGEKEILAEKVFNPKEDITREDLKGFREELESLKTDGKWLSLARNIARLQQAGIVIKKEKQERWFETLRAQMEMFRHEAEDKADPRKYALYLSYLKYSGAISEKDLSQEDTKILTDYYEAEMKSNHTNRMFLKYCASLRFLGVKKDYQEAEGRLSAIALETATTAFTQDTEVDRVGNAGKAMAEDFVRLNYLGISTEGFLKKTEVTNYLKQTLNATRENKSWGRFVSLAVLYKHLRPNERVIETSDQQNIRERIQILQRASRAETSGGTRQRLVALIAQARRLGMPTISTSSSIFENDQQVEQSASDTAIMPETIDTVIVKNDAKEKSKQLDPRAEYWRLYKEKPELLKSYLQNRIQTEQAKVAGDLMNVRNFTIERQGILTTIAKQGFKISGVIYQYEFDRFIKKAVDRKAEDEVKRVINLDELLSEVQKDVREIEPLPDEYIAQWQAENDAQVNEKQALSNLEKDADYYTEGVDEPTVSVKIARKKRNLNKKEIDTE